MNFLGNMVSLNTIPEIVLRLFAQISYSEQNFPIVIFCSAWTKRIEGEDGTIAWTRTFSCPGAVEIVNGV